METNRCHHASGCALECCLEGFAVLDGHKSTPSRERCALQARGMAIAVSDELQERGMQGLHGRAWLVGVLPANHRASGYALECCPEGFATLDGHKLMPSRESMCPGGS